MTVHENVVKVLEMMERAANGSAKDDLRLVKEFIATHKGSAIAGVVAATAVLLSLRPDTAQQFMTLMDVSESFKNEAA